MIICDDDVDVKVAYLLLAGEKVGCKEFRSTNCSLAIYTDWIFSAVIVIGLFAYCCIVNSDELGLVIVKVYNIDIV